MSFRDEVQSLLHDRLLDAALSLIEDSGWSAVTMAKIAESGGVSRQTVYNEFGTKTGVADALTMRELGRFVDEIRSRMLAADDVIQGIRSACEGALLQAEQSPLLRAVLGTLHGGESDLLPLITTQSQGLIEGAAEAVREALLERFGDLGLPDEGLRVAIDAIVRTVLSHMMSPANAPAETADGIAWLAAQVLRQSGSQLPWNPAGTR